MAAKKRLVAPGTLGQATGGAEPANVSLTPDHPARYEANFSADFGMGTGPRQARDPQAEIVADFDAAIGTEQAREEARRAGRDPLAGIAGRSLPIEGWPIPPGSRDQE